MQSIVLKDNENFRPGQAKFQRPMNFTVKSVILHLNKLY